MGEPTICPKCKAEPAPYTGIGTPVRSPGTLHHSTCPEVSWMFAPNPERQRRFTRSMRENEEAERAAWLACRDVLL